MRRWAEAAAPPKPGTPPATAAPPPAAAARPSGDGGGSGAMSDSAAEAEADAELPPAQLPAEVLEAERAAQEVRRPRLPGLTTLYGAFACCAQTSAMQHLSHSAPAGVLAVDHLGLPDFIMSTCKKRTTARRHHCRVPA
jgi:hypothetical protein